MNLILREDITGQRTASYNNNRKILTSVDGYMYVDEQFSRMFIVTCRILFVLFVSSLSLIWIGMHSSGCEEEPSRRMCDPCFTYVSKNVSNRLNNGIQ